MTPASQDSVYAAKRASDFKIIGLVSAAHFVSHYHYVVLPPLFFLVKPEFDVSYTELGLTLMAFYGISALLQIPAGFLIDRISKRGSLIACLLLGGGAYVVAGLVSNFYIFVAMFVLAGIANTGYHPADYSILSRRISTSRMSHAFSVHSFVGYLGSGIAPVCQVALAGALGWRGAFVAAGFLGIAVAAVIVLFGKSLTDAKPEKSAAAPPPQSTPWDILLSPAMLANVALYILIQINGGVLQMFALVALQDLWGVSLAVAATAVSLNLIVGAVGVLAGGVIAARTARQDVIAMSGMALTAITVFPLAWFDLGPAIVLVLMALTGFFAGLITPSRDLLVKAATPAGAFGAVFGYVTTGFAIGGFITPIIFGYFMDHGWPAAVFIGSGISALLIIVLVLVNVPARRRATQVQPAE